MAGTAHVCSDAGSCRRGGGVIVERMYIKARRADRTVGGRDLPYLWRRMLRMAGYVAAGRLPAAGVVPGSTEQLAFQQVQPLFQQAAGFNLAVGGQFVDDLRQQLGQAAGGLIR